MKTSKYYLVGLTAIVVGLMCCGPVSAEFIYDFNGLTAGAALGGQDNWVTTGVAADVVTEANANKHGDDANWTGFSGNVLQPTAFAGVHTRLNDTNWSFSIPSNAPEARFSYTIFADNDSGRCCLIGLDWDERTSAHPLFCFGPNSGNQYRFRASDGGSTWVTGTGDAALTGSYQSYVLTAVLDFTTDPTKVYADLWVENLTIGSAAVEVMSDIDLNLSDADLDPSNWNELYLRPASCAVDNLTVTVIPEPSTLVGLLGLGLLGLVAWRRR